MVNPMPAQSHEQLVGGEVEGSESKGVDSDGNLQKSIGSDGPIRTVGPRSEEPISESQPPMKAAMTTVCA
jgi:hypothetical protein